MVDSMFVYMNQKKTVEDMDFPLQRHQETLGRFISTELDDPGRMSVCPDMLSNKKCKNRFTKLCMVYLRTQPHSQTHTHRSTTEDESPRHKTETALSLSFMLSTRATLSAQHADPVINKRRLRNWHVGDVFVEPGKNEWKNTPPVWRLNFQ